MTTDKSIFALLDLLAARTGLVCLVGAGGKKTALYRLAAAHPGRVGITATVHIPFFPVELEARQVIADLADLPGQVATVATQARRVAYACPSAKPHRLAGVPAALVAPIHRAAGFDVTLIKADGARARLIKAPAADEPQLPTGVTTVIPVVSARALGRPLNAGVAHRPELLAALTGAALDEPLTPLHLARLLSAQAGSLRGVGQAQVVPLINGVDDAARARLARQVAEQALALTDRYTRVVLTALRQPQPLVAVLGDWP